MMIQSRCEGSLHRNQPDNINIPHNKGSTAARYFPRPFVLSYHVDPAQTVLLPPILNPFPQTPPPVHATATRSSRRDHSNTHHCRRLDHHIRIPHSRSALHYSYFVEEQEILCPVHDPSLLPWRVHQQG